FQVVGAQCFSPSSMQEISAAGTAVLLVGLFFTLLLPLEFIRAVQNNLPRARRVLIGVRGEGKGCLWGMGGGAGRYGVKEASAHEVVSGVRAVANGEAICPPQLCMSLFRYVSRQWNQLPSFQVKTSLGLTNREQQLAVLIGRGLTNKEIASQLNLSEQT